MIDSVSRLVYTDVRMKTQKKGQQPPSKLKNGPELQVCRLVIVYRIGCCARAERPCITQHEERKNNEDRY